jgi:hypothetical protein
MAETARYSTLRDVIALVVVAAACPLAVFGGAMLGCVGQSFVSECAMRAGFISPVLLVGAGAIAGLVTRGWTGLLVVLVGTFTGMVAILLVSFGVARPVPLDWFSAIVATIWFSVPIVIGYGVGRLAHRWYLARTGRGGRTDEPGGTDTGAGI